MLYRKGRRGDGPVVQTRLGAGSDRSHTEYPGI